MERIKALWAYYYKPTSLTWLSGFAGVLLGVAMVLGEGYMPLKVLGDVVAGINGISSNPVQIIIMGLGLMGIGARKGEGG